MRFELTNSGERFYRPPALTTCIPTVNTDGGTWTRTHFCSRVWICLVCQLRHIGIMSVNWISVLSRVHMPFCYTDKYQMHLVRLELTLGKSKLGLKPSAPANYAIGAYKTVRRDLNPPESEDTWFTVRTATNYGLLTDINGMGWYRTNSCGFSVRRFYLVSFHP